jgi:hypothetical protein
MTATLLGTITAFKKKKADKFPVLYGGGKVVSINSPLLSEWAALLHGTKTHPKNWSDY